MFLGEATGLGLAIVWRIVSCGVLARETIGGVDDGPGEGCLPSPIISFNAGTFVAEATCHGEADVPDACSSASGACGC